MPGGKAQNLIYRFNGILFNVKLFIQYLNQRMLNDWNILSFSGWNNSDRFFIHQNI